MARGIKFMDRATEDIYAIAVDDNDNMTQTVTEGAYHANPKTIANQSGIAFKVGDKEIQAAKADGVVTIALEEDEDGINSEAELIQALALGGKIELGKDIKVASGLKVKKNVTLDMKGHKIYNEADLWDTTNHVYAIFTVDGAKLTVKGEGTIDCKENDCFCINVLNGGKAVITNGKFNGNISCVQVDKGEADINGGEFELKQLDNSKGAAFMLNCIDANYTSGDAKIIVKGGKFHNNFNPKACAAETADETTDFCAEGYIAATVEENVWEVVQGLN